MARPADHPAGEATRIPFEGEAWPLGRVVGNEFPSDLARLLGAAPPAAVAWGTCGRLDREASAGRAVYQQYGADVRHSAATLFCRAPTNAARMSNAFTS